VAGGSRLRIEPLSAAHDRTGFASGAPELDRYLRVQAGQDAKRHLAAPFVLLDPATGAVIGYYTLSAFGVTPTEFPPELARRLPRYPLLPTTLLGRLAVTKTAHGRGYGQLLLLDALHRTFNHAPEIATLGVVEIGRAHV
jgi:GNAT superfamily N-acetyltransferase